MAIKVDIHYGVVFGKGDASDWVDYECELTDEEEIIYNNALRLRKDLNKVPELQDALNRAYDDIEKEEIALGIENDDEYVMECQGLMLLDPDEVNDKVADRDPHTLEFFGLTEMCNEELDEWDANDVDMPAIGEFDPDFEPYSPFDEGWILNVEYINLWENKSFSEEEARMILKELFHAADSDYSEVKDFIYRCGYNFVAAQHGGNEDALAGLAKEIAVELGMTDYGE